MGYQGKISESLVEIFRAMSKLDSNERLNCYKEFFACEEAENWYQELEAFVYGSKLERLFFEELKKRRI